jgi:calcium-dependent protein kinase
MNEVAALKTLDHPNVVKLLEIFEDQKRIYLVMEMCDGGELLDRIIK